MEGGQRKETEAKKGNSGLGNHAGKGMKVGRGNGIMDTIPRELMEKSLGL